MEAGLTDGASEGLNCNVETVKDRVSGLYTLQFFTDMITLAVGGVDLTRRFPQKFVQHNT